MKTIRFCLCLAVILFSVNICYATVEITRDDIFGDETFKDKVMSLTQSDEVVSNALYVATDGDDSTADGSKEKPYATLKEASRDAQPGQTIYLRGGTYYEEASLRSSGSAEGGYITIRNYPGEKVVFENNTSEGICFIDLYGNSYIIIEGIEFSTNYGTNDDPRAIMMRAMEHHIIIRNNTIHDIKVTDPSSGNANAIICYGKDAAAPINNVAIINNNVYNCATGWSEALTVVGNCEYVSVLNNTVKNTGNIGIDFAGNFDTCSDASLDQARYCIAKGNTVSECISPNARSYGLYNDGGRDNVFDRNIVFGCSGGIEIGSEKGGISGKGKVENITVTNNLVYDNIEVGIAVGGYSITNTEVGTVYNVKVYNNTLVNNGDIELNISKSDNLDYRNNIIYGALPDGYSSSYKYGVRVNFSSDYITNLNFANNIYYSPDGKEAFCFRTEDNKYFDINSWIDKTGEYTDPLFNADYTLNENSPAVDFGDNSVSSVVGAYDLAGNSRNISDIDAGCYEVQKSLVSTSQTTTETTTETTTDAATETTTKDLTGLSKITVKNNVGGFIEEYFADGRKIVVNARDLEDKKFCYWYVDNADLNNPVVSYDKTYSFVVDGDFTLSAQYEDNNTTVTKEAKVSFYKEPLVNDDTYTFSALKYLNGKKFVNCGLLISGSSNLDLDNYEKKGTFTTNTTNNYKVNVNLDASFNGNCYARAFMTYDSNGETVVYSDVLDFNVNIKDTVLRLKTLNESYEIDVINI